MSPWSSIAAEAQADGTAVLLLLLAFALPLVRRFAPEQRRRVGGLVLLTAAHLVLLVIAALLQPSHPELYRDVRLAALVCAALATASALVATRT